MGRIVNLLVASRAAVVEAAAPRKGLEAAIKVTESKVTELDSALALELAECGSRECTVWEVESRLDADADAEELRDEQARNSSLMI